MPNEELKKRFEEYKNRIINEQIEKFYKISPEERIEYINDLIEVNKKYPFFKEGDEDIVDLRICDDENGVLTMERELEDTKATVEFDVKKYTVAVTLECNGESKRIDM